jgi:predicted kinase
MKILYIVRGLPGSGKSTLARQIAPLANFAADDYFFHYNSNQFDASLLSKAHKWCFMSIESKMIYDEPQIAVHNTFTQKWEYQPYLDLAEKHGYMVHMIIVENHHQSESIHDVPQEAIEKMRNRFEINL